MTGVSPIIRSIQRHLKAESLPQAMFFILASIFRKFRGVYFSRIFRAKGLFMGPHSIIRGSKHISIGKGFFALDGLWLEAVVYYRDQTFSPQIVIGDRVSLSSQVHITCIDRITIGNQVLFGSKIYISDHNHGRYSGADQSQPSVAPADRLLSPGGPVFIEDNVWIGDNVVILGPVRIGWGAIVAANSVVRGDVPPATIVAGAPAKPIKRFNSESNCWEKV